MSCYSDTLFASYFSVYHLFDKSFPMGVRDAVLYVAVHVVWGVRFMEEFVFSHVDDVCWHTIHIL
jgi:hypothetical protein